MAGKRFRRTTSMSQLGSCSADMVIDRNIIQFLNPPPLPSANPHNKVARPLITEQKHANVLRQEDMAIAVPEEVAMIPDSFSTTGYEVNPNSKVNINPSLMSNINLNPNPNPNPNSNPNPSLGVFPDRTCGETLNPASSIQHDHYHELNMPRLVAYQMGLWAHSTAGNSVIVSTSYHGSITKQEPHHLHHHQQYVFPSSPVDFLQACFFCKRRIGHGRDIFIHRGDRAFCSEECRRNQILDDERKPNTERSPSDAIIVTA